jgi:hypothetical protein
MYVGEVEICLSYKDNAQIVLNFKGNEKRLSKLWKACHQQVESFECNAFLAWLVAANSRQKNPNIQNNR